MTCRNYIPGPNGDCQRCGEMGMNHAGTKNEKCCGRPDDCLWGGTACGEMRAGHAGSIDADEARYQAAVKQAQAWLAQYHDTDAETRASCLVHAGFVYDVLTALLNRK